MVQVSRQQMTSYALWCKCQKTLAAATRKQELLMRNLYLPTGEPPRRRLASATGLGRQLGQGREDQAGGNMGWQRPWSSAPARAQ
jgi:hypothetical protein